MQSKYFLCKIVDESSADDFFLRTFSKIFSGLSKEIGTDSHAVLVDDEGRPIIGNDTNPENNESEGGGHLADTSMLTLLGQSGKTTVGGSSSSSGGASSSRNRNPNQRVVRMNYQAHQSCVGTPMYVAPEVFNKGIEASFQVDVWALGVIFFVLVEGKFPFNDTLGIYMLQHEYVLRYD